MEIYWRIMVPWDVRFPRANSMDNELPQSKSRCNKGSITDALYLLSVRWPFTV